jgi:hypothetical protein
MQINILWTGREYYSLENCLVNTTPTGSIITSTIVGRYGEKIYQVEYTIKTNPRWETVSLQLTYQHSDFKEHFLLEGDGKGNWRMNGKEEEQFKDCIDVDIAVTPFTNTLPINRLRLQEGQSHEIQVIYFDILEQQIRPVRQQYTRVADKTYHYENIPNDFEANITVDERGLVVDYPSLFVRTAALEANYP